MTQSQSVNIALWASTIVTGCVAIFEDIDFEKALQGWFILYMTIYFALLLNAWASKQFDSK